MDNYMILNKNANTDVKLKDLTLVKEDGLYFLNAVYTVETGNRIEEHRLPRVSLPISTDRFAINYGGYPSIACKNFQAEIGFGYTTLGSNPDGHHYIVEHIKTKTKEMTLEEIEKKLGHKVKIVNK